MSGIATPAINASAGTAIAGDVALPGATTGQGSVSALRPGDIDISFGTAASDAEDGPIAHISGDVSGAHIQSVSLSFSMSRSPLERLGTNFPFARTVDFPVNASLSVSAIVNTASQANLAAILTGEVGKTIQVTFKNAAGTAQSSFKLTNAKLDSESYSSSIGSNKTVDLTFSTQIGGPADTVNNILYSGVNAVTPFA